MPFVCSNYHTHTTRCQHAVGTEAEYLDQAVRSGYRALGFTDHIGWPFPNGYVSPIRMRASQMPEYASAILRLKEEYSSRIHVHLGAECEYFPDFLPWLKEEKERLGLEYLILGVHYPPNEIGYSQFAGSTTPRELSTYTELAVAGMESGLFTYLCHPDLPLKTYPRFDRWARRMSEELCAAAKRLDMPLEYNLAGLWLRGAVPTGLGYTSDEFWQIAADYGCTAIIAMDAHKPEALSNTDAVRTAYQKLTSMGIPVLDLLPGLDARKDDEQDAKNCF
ncbi:MAG: histidinol-phosphatase [Lawsonibacter sp.]